MRIAWPVKFYRVAGYSMMPHYHPGDLILGWRWFRLHPGQVVVMRSERVILKRIKQIYADMVWVEGDNSAHSTDSRQFGGIPKHQIESMIIARF